MHEQSITDLTVEKMLVENAAARLIPINAVLELTPLCNLDCKMCFVRLSKEEMEKKGRLRTLEEWKALADEMMKAGTLFVLLTGGEPLTYPYFKELYLYLRSMGMILTINTNGTLIDEEWADFFGKYKPRRINITIYGKNADTYEQLCHNRSGFEKAVKAIELLNARGVSVKMNGSITPSNAADGEALIDLAKKLNVFYKLDTYMYPACRERANQFDDTARLSPEEAARVRVHLLEYGQENFDEYAEGYVSTADSMTAGEEIPLPVSCRAGNSSFVINWQGMLRPCVMVTTPELSMEPGHFIDAWKELTDIVSKIRMSAKCNACTLKDVCQNCAACALLETGSYDGVPEYMCQYTKETLSNMRAAIERRKNA